MAAAISSVTMTTQATDSRLTAAAPHPKVCPRPLTAPLLEQVVPVSPILTPCVSIPSLPRHQCFLGFPLTQQQTAAMRTMLPYGGNRSWRLSRARRREAPASLLAHRKLAMPAGYSDTLDHDTPTPLADTPLTLPPPFFRFILHFAP